MTLFSPLPDKKYDIIYADPPWKYNNNLIHRNGEWVNNADNHYPTLTTKDLMSLPVKDIASPDCLLFMWATGPMANDAFKLGEAWGFKWATVAFVWDKQKRMNAGYYTVPQCEFVFVFKRGRIPKPRGARNIQQFVSEPRKEHSVKPEEVRDRINLLFPEQSKIELFARRKSDGWDVWGNEV